VSRILIPVKKVNGADWGDLSVLALTHEIVGEVVHLADENFSFGGGHRVRKYKFKKNVHFKVPVTAVFDISAVPPGATPRKQRP